MGLILCLVLAAADANATLPVGPAPGAPAAAEILVAGRSVALDETGRARIALDATPEGSELRFYRTTKDATNGEQVYYYPDYGTLVTWPLRGADDARKSAELLVKEHGKETWETARVYTAAIEPADRARHVRFVLPPGTWDVALLAPGYAPAFVDGLLSKGAPVTISAARLERGGRVTARILDERSGKPPVRWTAWATRFSADPKTEESRLFEKRPIGRDGERLDFDSLPVGSWEIRLESPQRSGQRKEARVPAAGSLAALGDLFVTDFGSIRVTLAFPDERPEGVFEIKLTRRRYEMELPPLTLGRRSMPARNEATLVFSSLEPGELQVEAVNEESGIQTSASAVVEPNRQAEVRLSVRPVRVHGTVLHGDKPVAAAEVEEGGRGPGKRRSTTSDELGAYTLDVWSGRESLALLTKAPGQQVPFLESFPAEPDALEVEHDIHLPAAQIRGTVRDAETGEIVRGAEVAVSTAIAESAAGDGPDDSGEITSFALSIAADEEGQFVIDNLRSRPVDVEVSKEGYAASRFPAVKPTAEGVDLDVRLERGVRLVGSVTDEHGAPIPGAVVGLDVASQGWEFSRTTVTSGDGRYEFRTVASGEHVLGVLACGRSIVLRRLSVESPESLEDGKRTEDVAVSDELPPIAVTVRNGDGSPAKAPVRYAIDGNLLPLASWTTAFRSCGISDTPDAQGRVIVHGFPEAIITAYGIDSATPYGSFRNDGTRTEWAIEIPGGAHLEAEQQALR